VIAVDTNLLVYAHRGAVPEHQAAQAALERASRERSGWGVAVACIAEFWSVVTHPKASGRPSTPDEAQRFLDALIEDGGLEVWSPGPGFGARLVQMATQLEISGPRIFDLQIALTAFDNGATELWSHDRAFVSFPGLMTRDPL
jgi:toxin-antitoxin system PIN domain toxin